MTNSPTVVPPPLIFLAFFAAGWFIEFVIPISVHTAFIIRYAGWAFAVLSAIITVLGFNEFYLARTTILPNRAASTLITSGIFRVSRNPLYLSLLLLYIGASIYFSIWWSVVLAPLLVFIMNRYVIRTEEVFLAEKFSELYRAYCARVRRWL